MHLYQDQFDCYFDFNASVEASKILVIASTARCGSHMLGHALHQTQCFGAPFEYANPVNIKEWQKRLGGNDIETIMGKIKIRRTSPNGVFSIKVHYHHLGQFGGFKRFQQIFPNADFLLLNRSDLVRQAVSLSVAMQSGVWIAGQRPQSKSVIYDFDHINKCLRTILRENASWRYLLNASGSKVKELNFEQVKNDLGETVKEIGQFAGVVLDDTLVPSNHVTTKQSDDQSSEWEVRFKSDFNQSRDLTL